MMATHEVGRLVSLPIDQTGARNAESGRIWPLEPGVRVRVRVRVTLSPARTRLIFAHTGFINGAGYFDRLLQPSG